MNKRVRTRFAPSPTGPLNVGGLRTALYAYLFARKHAGDFILRIEDTDQLRKVEGTEEYISEALEWVGIDIDESPKEGGEYGPYRQSERKEIYNKYAEQILQSGHAYYAFDTPEEIEQMRTREKEAGVHTPKYDHSVRDKMRNGLTLSAAEVQDLLDKKVPYVIRLKVDTDQQVGFDDLIRERVEFSSNELDDKVLMKADGMPTYHFANIVDDYSMKISHVIRGEEWLSSTAHHVLLYRALGLEEHMPKFAHLPLILKPVGKGKLSKRDSAKFGFPVFPIDWKGQGEEDSFDGFREFGFLPQALLNFLAFIGWNPGTDQEIFDKEDLIKSFSIEKIVKAGARFDWDKAKWYNQQYIMAMGNVSLTALVAPRFEEAGYRVEEDFVRQYCELMRERVENLNDFVAKGDYFFNAPTSYEEKMVRKKFKPENVPHFHTIVDKVKDAESAEGIEQIVKGYISDNDLKFGEIFPILRLAISGTMQGPDLFKMWYLIGIDEVGQRISSAVDAFVQIKSA